MDFILPRATFSITEVDLGRRLRYPHDHVARHHVFEKDPERKDIMRKLQSRINDGGFVFMAAFIAGRVLVLHQAPDVNAEYVLQKDYVYVAWVQATINFSDKDATEMGDMRSLDGLKDLVLSFVFGRHRPLADAKSLGAVVV
jgi:hypothetical protein